MRTSFLIAVATATALAGAALAHQGATGTVADRMATMKIMDKELKAIQAMLSGSKKFDLGQLREYVAVLHENCHQSESMFPAGSLDRHSQAKPAVWDDPD